MAYEATIRILRDGKAILRHTRQRATLEQKLMDLWRGQHVYVQIVGGRRQLRPNERPWNIRSDVKESVVISSDGFESAETPISSSRSQWILAKPQAL